MQALINWMQMKHSGSYKSLHSAKAITKVQHLCLSVLNIDNTVQYYVNTLEYIGNIKAAEVLHNCGKLKVTFNK